MLRVPRFCIRPPVKIGAMLLQYNHTTWLRWK